MDLVSNMIRETQNVKCYTYIQGICNIIIENK